MKNKNAIPQHDAQSQGREAEISAENMSAEIDAIAGKISEATGETGEKLVEDVNEFFADKTIHDARNDREELPGDFAKDAAVTVSVVGAGAQGEMPTAAFRIGENSAKDNDARSQDLGEELKEYVERNGDADNANAVSEEVARGEAAATRETKSGIAEQTSEDTSGIEPDDVQQASENIGGKGAPDAQNAVDWGEIKTAADVEATIGGILSGGDAGRQAGLISELFDEDSALNKKLGELGGVDLDSQFEDATLGPAVVKELIARGNIDATADIMGSEIIKMDDADAATDLATTIANYRDKDDKLSYKLVGTLLDRGADFAKCDVDVHGFFDENEDFVRKIMPHTDFENIKGGDFHDLSADFAKELGEKGRGKFVCRHIGAFADVDLEGLLEHNLSGVDRDIDNGYDPLKNAGAKIYETLAKMYAEDTWDHTVVNKPALSAQLVSNEKFRQKLNSLTAGEVRGDAWMMRDIEPARLERCLEFVATSKTVGGFIGENVHDIGRFDEYFAPDGSPTGALWHKSFELGDLDLLEKSDSGLASLDAPEREVMGVYSRIDGDSLKSVFRDYAVQNMSDLMESGKAEMAANVLDRLSSSNASELAAQAPNFAKLVLSVDNPMNKLREIEDIYLRNNLPVFVKNFSVFEAIFPKEELAKMINHPTVSPVLKENVDNAREIIFADLEKAALGSNNRSAKEWIATIARGQTVIDRINASDKIYGLSGEESEDLNVMRKHLAAMAKMRDDGEPSRRKNLLDLNHIAQEFGTDEVGLADRTAELLASSLGMKSFAELQKYIEKKPREADARNRERAKRPFTLERGDFIKGLRGVKYLASTLQNGSVAGEFLGESPHSDATPLDADVAKVLEDSGDINSGIAHSMAGGYDSPWLVLKHGDRLEETRGDEKSGEGYDPSKLEVFSQGEDHYGVRTGFSSGDIDFIVSSDGDSRIGFEIARNGFYIPVVSRKTGELIFTPEQFDDLREKMSGMKYYDAGEYRFSEDLESSKIRKISARAKAGKTETTRKRGAIEGAISQAMIEQGLALKTAMDTVDLTPGSVELLDTGSTGRGTNEPGDGDFDLMMRVDREVMKSPERLGELKSRLREIFADRGADSLETGDGNFRYKQVKIAGLDARVDVDITFATKTNRLDYTSEQALKDRLATMRAQNLEKYEAAIANILQAKETLKAAGVYKNSHAANPQGGLGGIGIENWILQNGGSFREAANDFLVAARGKDFDEFKKTYKIWDFGQNHMSESRGNYPFDGFVDRNMDSDGFVKMRDALEKFVAKPE